jgi:DUF1009 family protein
MIHGLKRDDAFLRLAATAFAKRKIDIIDPRPLIDSWFAGKGLLAGPVPSAAVAQELDAGFESARSFVKTGRGQSVVCYQGKIWSVENLSGTDSLIAGAPGPGSVLVKITRPGQDMRFDVPVIGPSTVLLASKVGMSAIGVESGRVMILEKQKVFELCSSHRITLTGG